MRDTFSKLVVSTERDLNPGMDFINEKFSWSLISDEVEHPVDQQVRRQVKAAVRREIKNEEHSSSH